MFENLVAVAIKNEGQSFHWHEEMELDFVLCGSAEVLINNRKIDLSIGDIIVINSEDVHCVNRQDEELLYVQLLFNMENFEQYIPDISTVIFKCEPQKNDVLSENLKDEIKQYIVSIIDLINAADDQENREQDFVYSCIEILNNLKFGFKYADEEYGKTRDEYQWDRLWKIIEYMYDNCCRKLSLGEVANQVFLSEVYLSRIIKKHSGKNFEEFLAFIRAETSIRYLLDAKMSITNIAYECGFSAPRYYNKAFESNYGCSPAEWRNKNKLFLEPVKSVKSSDISYDEQVDPEAARRLLKKYDGNSEPENERQALCHLDVDLTQKLTEDERLPQRAEAVICSMEQALDYKTAELLAICRDRLHIGTVILEGGRGKHAELAAQNLLTAGFEVLREKGAVSSVRLSDLFWQGGLKSPDFYLQELLPAAETLHHKISPEIFFSKHDKGVKLLIFNGNSGSDRKYLINFLGLKEAPFYWFKRVTTRDLSGIIKTDPDSAKALSDTSRKYLDEFLRPSVELDMIDSNAPVISEVKLSPGQLCMITLYPIIKK